ncbi:MAG: bifunctional precorrin-2 dehydrogenase/sirohydrochlorin ferrochelatase [Planctomycetia bacterium]|nr:bifunctional precorrin-2 dehydrogenase/sirohydrochlorin ferrochelatase [Planctomycetia bacterium]
MFPLFIDLRGRLAVVVGGGPVGRRKCAALLAADARVRLVCLEPRPGDQTSPALAWLQEPFRPAHLENACLAFAAGPTDINRQVAAAARERGLWVNCADDPEASDFFVPATVRRGSLVIAVGTQGAAPALARQVRQQLERQFDAAFSDWTALLAELRPLAQSRIADPAHRRAFLSTLAQRRWLRRLRREGRDAVRQAMLAELRSLERKSDDPV